MGVFDVTKALGALRRMEVHHTLSLREARNRGRGMLTSIAELLNRNLAPFDGLDIKLGYSFTRQAVVPDPVPVCAFVGQCAAERLPVWPAVCEEGIDNIVGKWKSLQDLLQFTVHDGIQGGEQPDYEGTASVSGTGILGQQFAHLAACQGGHQQFTGFVVKVGESKHARPPANFALSQVNNCMTNRFDRPGGRKSGRIDVLQKLVAQRDVLADYLFQVIHRAI